MYLPFTPSGLAGVTDLDWTPLLFSISWVCFRKPVSDRLCCFTVKLIWSLTLSFVVSLPVIIIFVQHCTFASPVPLHCLSDCGGSRLWTPPSCWGLLSPVFTNHLLAHLPPSTGLHNYYPHHPDNLQTVWFWYLLLCSVSVVTHYILVASHFDLLDCQLIIIKDSFYLSYFWCPLY